MARIRKMQCDHWTGWWCVTEIGKEIQGSRVERGRGLPHCESEIIWKKN